MARQTLHEIVEQLPETKITVAERFRQCPASGAAFRAGHIVRHDEIVREFGV